MYNAIVVVYIVFIQVMMKCVCLVIDELLASVYEKMVIWIDKTNGLVINVVAVFPWSHCK